MSKNLFEQTLTHEEHQIFIGDFLDKFAKYKSYSLQKGIQLKSKKRIENPFSYSIQIATLDDAEDIANIIKKVYKGTYPHKELEDPTEIKRMMEDPYFTWVVFKKESGENIACGGYHIDLQNKSGTFHAFALLREYHGQIHAGKAALIFMVTMFSQFRGKILHWSCEVVSKHSKSQNILTAIGWIPIAFLPKKDLFFGSEVSEFIFIIYDEKIFTSRSAQIPSIINRAMFSYFYSQQKFNLELPEIHGMNTRHLELDKKKLQQIRENLVVKIEQTRFNKELVTIYSKFSNSYIRFLHRTNIHSIEKAEYKVHNNEELSVFLEKIKAFIKDQSIQYFEAFVPAYETDHQKLFHSAGFKPTGYIPCWKYDSSQDCFNDNIVFVFYQGKNLDNVRLIPDTIKFLQTIKFYNKITGLKPF